jgi:hypothetical protein
MVTSGWRLALLASALVAVPVVGVGGGAELSASAGATAQAEGCSLGAGVVPLANGVGQDFTMAAGGACDFSFAPAAGMGVATFLVERVGPAIPLPFLYVRLGAPATATENDCAYEYQGGPNDACQLPLGEDGLVLFARVAGGEADNAYRITAGASESGCTLGRGVHALAEDQPLAMSFLATGEARCDVTFTPSGTADLAKVTAQMNQPCWCGFGILVRQGRFPTSEPPFTNFDLRVPDSTLCLTPSQTSTCGLAILDSTPLFLTVRGSASLGLDLGLRATSVEHGCSLGRGIHPLGSGASGELGSVPGSTCFFAYTPPPGQDVARLEFTGSPLHWIGASFRNTPPPDYYVPLYCAHRDTCDRVASPSTIFAHVWRLGISGGGGSFSVAASSFVVAELQSGVPLVRTAGAGQNLYAKAVLGPGATRLSVAEAGVDTRSYCGGSPSRDHLAVGFERLPLDDDIICGDGGEELVGLPGYGVRLFDDCVAPSGAACLFGDPELPPGLPVGRVQSLPLPGPGRYFVAVHGQNDGFTHALVASYG